MLPPSTWASSSIPKHRENRIIEIPNRRIRSLKSNRVFISHLALVLSGASKKDTVSIAPNRISFTKPLLRHWFVDLHLRAICPVARNSDIQAIQVRHKQRRFGAFSSYDF